MPIRPRTPAKPAPTMAVGAAPPVVDVVAASALEDEAAEAVVDVPVVVEDLVVMAVELPYLPVDKAVVLPEEPVVRATVVGVTPAGVPSL